jgi:hypothetical protein
MNLLPEHLDYQFTQILFIGERSAIAGEETIHQLEKLEDEDEARVNHLKRLFLPQAWVLTWAGDDAIFKGLEMNKTDFLPGALHG